MLDLLAAWLLYPLALGAVCLGLGLLVGRAAGWDLPGALLLPVGFVTLLALARLATSYASTAPLALPVIGVLAVAGLAIARRRLRALRPDPWLLAAVAGLFAVCAAPVVLTGEPTFAGYLALPDIAHHLSLAELYSERGPDWEGLPPGSYRQSTLAYVITSYPVAAQAALGVTGPLGGLDLAWLYQPFLAFALVVLSLAMWSLGARVLRHRWQAAVVAFAAPQSALVVGNYLTGSIKELAAVAALTTLVAVLAAALDEQRRLRVLLPVAIAAAAAFGALGPAALAYLAVPGLVVLAVWGVALLRSPGRAELLALGAGAVVLAVFALPMLRTLKTAITTSTAVLVDHAAELGHLAAPLETVQALGIWFTGDFRYTALGDAETPQAIALWLAGACAIGGLLWALRRRRVGPLLLAATFVPVSIYLLHRGTPYADSKVLMIVSPAVLAFALLGAGVLWTGRWRVLGAVLTAALLGGVLWSSALAYHDVSLAPHARYAELLEINDRLAGRGPAFFGEYDEFAKYFLRDVPIFSSPEWPHAFRSAPYRPNALRDRRRRPSEKTPIDVDDVTLRYLESVPYIILRRGPQTSRPPADFRLESRLTYYDIWRRSPRPRVLAHLPLGRDVLHQGARVSETVARRWARRARARDGRIAYVVRERPPIYLETRDEQRPGRWNGFWNFPFGLVTNGPSNIREPLRIARTGLYHVWIEGSFARAISIGLDATPFARGPEGLNNPGAYASLGTVRITRGRHVIFIRQRGADLRPGTGGYRSSLRHMGPIFFNPVANEEPAVREIDADRWRELVGLRADWLEIVRR